MNAIYVILGAIGIYLLFWGVVKLVSSREAAIRVAKHTDPALLKQMEDNRKIFNWFANQREKVVAFTQRYRTGLIVITGWIALSIVLDWVDKMMSPEARLITLAILLGSFLIYAFYKICRWIWLRWW